MAGTALVLGGGGVAGIAWELGIVTGLIEAGADPTGTDLIVGTSAGSVVGALIATGVPLDDAYAAQLAGPGAELPAASSLRHSMAIALAAVRSRDPEAFGRRVGAIALAAPAVPEQRRRAVIETRLPVHDWPARPLLITAVDAQSGEFAVFRAASGVPLVDAVAASCAVPGVWPPVSIGGHRYMDGGLRSAANADLAADADRVLVIAPMTAGGGPLVPVADQVAALRAGGARVALVTPDDASLDAFGSNPLDPTRRAPAARAGRAQAAHVAAEVRAVLG
jgi:NTE family protein